MVNMGVGQNDRVDLRPLEWKIPVALKGITSPALVQTTIKQNFFALVMDQMHRTGNRLCRTPKLYIHKMAHISKLESKR